MMNKLVCDTDVIIAALRSPTGASAALLGEAYFGRITLLASVTLFCEYEAKCLLPEHYQAAGLNKTQAEQFLAGLAGLIKPVRPYFLWRPLLRDPNDEMVMEVAINGHADAIATFNIKDYRGVSQIFNRPIITPGNLLQRLRT